MRFINLRQRDPFQNFQCCRRGNREGAVRTIDRAAAILKVGDKHLLHPERLDSHASADDVRDRIERADFVEGDFFRRHAVNVALCHSDPMKDRQSACADHLGKFALLDQRADLTIAAPFRMIVIMSVMLGMHFMAVVMVVLVTFLLVMVVAAADVFVPFVRMRVFVSMRMLV